jgi:hypothetical protein
VSRDSLFPRVASGHYSGSTGLRPVGRGGGGGGSEGTLSSVLFVFKTIIKIHSA